MITSLLSLPEVRGIDLDSPEAVPLHREIIMRKAFLRKLYEDHYAYFKEQANALATLPGEMLEMGSGGGFLKTVLPEVITSDVAAYPSVDKVVLAEHLPFAAGGLKAIFLLNVLHHIPDPDLFFREAQRVLVQGGRLVMIEPFNSWFARLLYKNFHHEPFDETVQEWKVQGQGRLTASNQALPWIIFWRDAATFRARYPDLLVIQRLPHTVTGYPLSGGLSCRSLMPGFAYPFFKRLDFILSRMTSLFPIFQTIVIEKQ